MNEIYCNGVDEDLTNKVSWTIGDASIGTFVGATLELLPMTTPGARTTHIKASHESIEAKTQLIVVESHQTGPKTDSFFILPHMDLEGKNQTTQL